MPILPLYEYEFEYGNVYDVPTEQDVLSWQDAEDAEEFQDECSEIKHFATEPILDDSEDEDEEEIPF